MTQEQKKFIERVGALAAADMQKSGVLASLTIAQAILESGWGKSGLTVKGNALFGIKAGTSELHPKSWTRKSTKGVQKSMGKELFSEELKLAVVQYVLEGHTRKEASEKFCVSCTPIEKWVNLYKLHGAKGLLSRNLVGRQKGFDGEFRLKVLQYKQEHHLSCTQTAMHFCLDVVTVCRWEKKFQKEGAQGLMKKQATKGSEKRQKKQEQSELQQENKRLSEENYRLKMENDYLKKLNALIQKREKPE
jgi:transposase